jgi:hypothetical protein
MSVGPVLTSAHDLGKDRTRPGRSFDEDIVSKSVHLLAVCFAFVVAAGCEEGRLQVNPVHGQVTYKGQGVSNATVIFFPTGPVAEQLKKMRPYAYADQNGRFSLKTYVTGDGAPPGQYRVGIIAVVGSDRESNDGSQRKSAALPRMLVQKYGNHETSGIEVTVEPGENNLEPFELN